MLDHMEVISHDASMRQRQLHRRALRGAHVHAHRLDRIAITQAFEQVADLVFGPSCAHLKHLARIQVAQDAIIAMPLAAGKLVNAQVARGGQWRGFISAQVAFGQFHLGDFFQARLHQT